MRALRALTLASLCACAQEINIKPEDTDVPVPVDTDPGVPVGQPAIRVTPARLDFGSLPPSCPADPLTFTIENVGDATLEVQELTLTGPAAAYELSDLGPWTLAPAETVDVGVTFEAATYTAYNARVNVASNDPAKPTARVALLGEGSEAAFREEVFLQQQADKVDVLWVVDTSSSMTAYLDQVSGAMDRFIQSFVTLGLDYRMGVVTTDMDSAAHSGRMVGPWMDGTALTPAQVVQTFENQISQGDTGSTTERGYAAAKAALTTMSTVGFNTGFLRSDATIAVVVISDEDDRDATVEGTSTVYPNKVDQWVTWFQGLKGDPNDASFSALTCKNQAGWCSMYHRGINQTRGVWGNIDRQPIDINPFLTHLSFVAAGLNVAFQLGDTPINTSPSALTVTVDGVSIPFDPTQRNGWTWDASTNSIVFWGDAIPDPGEAIVVRYPYDAGC